MRGRAGSPDRVVKRLSVMQGRYTRAVTRSCRAVTRSVMQGRYTGWSGEGPVMERLVSGNLRGKVAAGGVRVRQHMQHWRLFIHLFEDY